jgi:hypothetical protein
VERRHRDPPRLRLSLGIGRGCRRQCSSWLVGEDAGGGGREGVRVRPNRLPAKPTASISSDAGDQHPQPGTVPVHALLPSSLWLPLSDSPSLI